MQSLFVNSQRKNLFISISYVLILWGLIDIQASHAETPSAEEMWETIQQQQKLIEELKARLDDTDQRVAMNEVKVEEATEEVEAAAEAFETAQASTRGSSWADRTTVGGYGELHYNNLSDNNDTVDGDNSLDQVDFHRFVLYFGHEFTDNIRFFSELELEHALSGDGESGEVELEQAWIEMDINDNHRFRAGVDILPIGIINVTHEPNTFYGVERNKVETEIIPATWWEAGIGFNGEIAPGWNYDIVAHGGLLSPNGVDDPSKASSTLRPRSGRSKVSKAEDQDIAFTGRLRYTGMPGLEVGISGQYQSDMTGTADAFDVDATLFEGHIDYKHASGFGLRALYARWDIDAPTGITYTQNSIDGWYIEPAYRFKAPGFVPGEIGVFTRYAEWDAIGGSGNVPNGVPDGTYVQFESWNVGMNWWPHPNVAFKFDYQNESGDSRAKVIRDGFNLGLAYQF
ncbi:MAG: porin [Proteobacteria bacterium]|nr:porin [Pseudomonadota bacterium]